MVMRPSKSVRQFFVPVFWWCSEAVGRTRVAVWPPWGSRGRSWCRPKLHQLCQPPPVVPGPVKPSNVLTSDQNVAGPAAHIQGYIGWLLGIGARLGRREDRLRRCFLHAASYNVIITASIPGEGGGGGASGVRVGMGGAMGRATRTQHQLNS